MRADNKGEGGSLALLALINQNVGGKRWTGGIVLLGVFATALFYGDSMITPAVSVLGAIEGIAVYQPEHEGAGRADCGRHPGFPVLDPEPRDRQGRAVFRADHAGLLRGDLGAGGYIDHRRCPR